mmetsp:Transcript_22480/g.35178  ORF Transcript_22480/g.35178 Transcript_22480/m.35178 type:complete len:99 (+) Transcript_22480:719-1015(+)
MLTYAAFDPDQESADTDVLGSLVCLVLRGFWSTSNVDPSGHRALTSKSQGSSSATPSLSLSIAVQATITPLSVHNLGGGNMIFRSCSSARCVSLDRTC